MRATFYVNAVRDFSVYKHRCVYKFFEALVNGVKLRLHSVYNSVYK